MLASERARNWLMIVVATAWLGNLWEIADARPIYVDNQNGHDASDGSIDELHSRLIGPVRTLSRALKLARRGDTIILRNSGIPYFGNLNLSGIQHSGQDNEAFTILGNGAEIHGFQPLDNDGWQRQPNGLWRLSLTRKGHYVFLRNGELVPEQQFPNQDWSADDLELNHWASRSGAVLMRLDPRISPLEESWEFSALETGISLVDVRNVRISDLKLSGFRFDGVNADNSCRNVVLENVTTTRNGRAGIAVGGSADVTAVNCTVLENGRYSVLITERGGIDLQNCELGGIEPAHRP